MMFDHNAKLTGHLQNLVVQCPVTDYFQHCNDYKISAETSLLLLFLFIKGKITSIFWKGILFWFAMRSRFRCYYDNERNNIGQS